MACATGLVKYFVFLANLIFSLGGLALVIVGVICQYKIGNIDVLPDSLTMTPILSIIIGAIVFFIAFLGCCGAVKESPCMLTSYAIVLLVLFIGQLAIGIWIFMQVKNKDDLNNVIENKMNKLFAKYNEDKASKELVDFIQKTLVCCGLDDYKSWNKNTLPKTCCNTVQNNDNSMSTCMSQSVTLHHDGCTPKIQSLVEENFQIVGCVFIGVAIVELLGAVFGFCLSSSISNNNRRSMYA